MASVSSIKPSEEKAFCFRLFSLVVDGGTIVLRHQFDTRIQKADLQNKLNDPTTRSTLDKLRKKNVIGENQWDVLYPQIKRPGKPCSEDFDITLLCLLLRYISGLDETSRYWSSGIPPSSDTSTLADISRLRQLRNEFAHRKTVAITNQVFQQKWNDLEQVLLRLGTGIPDLSDNITKLKTCTIDPENVSQYIEQIERWTQIEEEVKADIDVMKQNISKAQDNIAEVANTVNRQGSQLSDVTKQLTELTEQSNDVHMSYDVSLEEMKSRQNKFQKSITTEIKVCETQRVETEQRLSTVEEKVVHLQNVQPSIKVEATEDTGEMRRLKSIADLCVHDESRDQVYVTTKTHTLASNRLLKYGIVVLSGSPGEGKTTMATKLISEISKPGLCLKLNHPSDIKCVDFRSPTFDIIFIDDIFGKGILDDSLLKEWSFSFPDIVRLIQKTTKKVVITTRHYILSEAKQSLRSTIFVNENIQIVSSKDLTESEMVSMLDLHLQQADRNLSREQVELCIKSFGKDSKFQELLAKIENDGHCFSPEQWGYLKLMTGFPETVRLFSSNDELFRSGHSFFKNPYVFFRNVLEELFVDEEKFFPLFLIWSVPGQRINISQIENPDTDPQFLQRIRLAAEEFGLEKPLIQISKLLLTSLSHCYGGIIDYKKETGTYYFAHNTAKDMVGLVVGKKYPHIILKHASGQFHLQFTTVNEDKNDDFHIFIEPFRFGNLSREITNIMINKASEMKDRPASNGPVFLTSVIRIVRNGYEVYDYMKETAYPPILKHDCFKKDSFLLEYFKCETGIDKLLTPVDTISNRFGNNGTCIDLGNDKLPIYIASVALYLRNTTFLEMFMKRFWKEFPDKKNFLYFSLLIAAHTGQQEVVQLLINYGAEVDGETIFMASSRRNKNVVELLLKNYKHDSEIYRRVVNQNSPLIETTKRGYVEIMKILINHGADVNYRNANERSALDKALLVFSKLSTQDQVAKQFEMYKLLIEKGASFTDKTGKYKRTHLHIAADIGHTKVVKLLIEKGASLRDKDYRGHYPIHCAAIRGHCDIVEAILKADKTQVSLIITSPGSKSLIKGMTLLHIAIRRKDKDMVKLLLEHNADPNIQDSFGRTSFYAASYSNLIDILELLLKNSNPHQPEKNGMTPLHAAVFKGNSQIAQMIGQIPNEIEHFIKTPKNALKRRNSYYMVALERAIFLDIPEDCEYLLQNGAHLKYNTCSFKRTPLHFAADVGSSKTAELLISRGASLNVKDCRGYLPVQCAAVRKNNDIVRLILQADKTQAFVKLSRTTFRQTEMDLYHIAASRCDAVLCNILLQHGANPNVQDVFGRTPVNVAAKNGAYEVVKKLIIAADVNLADNKGNTPLHTAIQNENTEIAKILCTVSNVNAKNKYGQTPLHKCCECLNLDIFRLLIEKCGADVNIYNRKGYSFIETLNDEFIFDLMFDDKPYEHIHKQDFLKIVARKRRPSLPYTTRTNIQTLSIFQCFSKSLDV